VPNLKSSPILDQATLIVGRVLGFDSGSDAPLLQVCSHPQVEDNSTMQHLPDDDVVMVECARWVHCC
jgi:hypothetical protein